MRAKRTDANHAEIATVLRACGWKVKHVHTVPKFCDLVAQRGLTTRLVEVKTEKGKPTKAQVELREQGWIIDTVRDADDAINLR